jgi:DNA-binding NarL/FixJ family response regulator
MITADIKKKKIKVAIIEDHHDIRQGMAFLIDSDNDFEASLYANAEDALRKFKTDKPDIVLMDINLPGMNGIECTKIIKQGYPAVQIMMCTVYEDDEKIFNALAAGASGYMLKRAAGDSLLESIRELYNGGSPMSASIARKVTAFFQRKTSPENALLTQRENEILDLLAKGFRNKDIADQLCVSVNTIRTHIYHIYEKLHVENRVEALNKTGRSSFQH